MKSKKILSLLCLVLVVCAFTLTVSAANNNAIGYTVESSDSIVSAGKTFTVDFKISENTGFVWAQASLVYDPAQVEFVGVSTEGCVFPVSEAAGSLVAKHRETQHDIVVTIGKNTALFDPTSGEVFDQTGKVVSVTFKAAADYNGIIDLKVVCNQNNVHSVRNEHDFGITANVAEIKSVDMATHVHTEKILPAVPATCTTSGLTEGKQCTFCGEIYVKQETVETLGHLNDIKLSAVEATCIATGLTEGTKCSRCQTVTVAQKTVPMAAHTMPDSWTQTKAPACEGKGEEQRVCTVSGCNKTETREIAALGHDWNKTTAVDSTCSAEGKKALWVCKTCSAVDSVNNGATIAKKDHTPGVESGKKPTCTETGLTDRVYCLVCKETITAQETIPAAGHKWTAYVNDNADKHWKECEVCGEKADESAHKLGNGVCSVCGYGCSHMGGKATCSSQATCSLCGMKYGSKLPHTPGAAATCEENQVCTVCKGVVKYASGHKLVDHAAKAATCTEVGNDAYQTCENCDYTTYVEIAATGHTLVDHAAQAATCGAAGWDAYKACVNCDQTSYVEIPATGNHTYDNKCDADCNVCSATREPADHTYGEWETVKEATTEADGQKKHSCTECGYSETEKIPALQQNGAKEPGVPLIAFIALAVCVVALIVVVILLVIKKKK